MLLATLRVLFGFVMACLAAGVTKVLFAVGVQGLASGSSDEIVRLLILAAQFATVFAVFSSLFALLAAIVSEWQGLRGILFHGFVGLAIAGAGFAAQYLGEAPGAATVMHNYGIGAFATTGLVAGVVYWLFAGRLAGAAADADDIYDVVPLTKVPDDNAVPAPGQRPNTPAAPPPSAVQKPTPASTSVPTQPAKPAAVPASAPIAASKPTATSVPAVSDKSAQSSTMATPAPKKD